MLTRAALIDLDGTVRTGDALLPGAVWAIGELRALGLRLRFVTNTDSKLPEAIVAELAGLGLRIDASELFTPVEATRRLLSAENANALLVVSAAIRSALVGFAGDGPASHVVVGDCRDVLDYPLLDSAFRALREGARLIALQRGGYFKRADGDHLDTGAIVAALEYAAGVRARVMGKPAEEFFVFAARSAGCEPRECVVVGDDGATDIAGGRAIGARTVQVRTGKYRDQRADEARPRPDDEIDGIADLPDLLAEASWAR